MTDVPQAGPALTEPNKSLNPNEPDLRYQIIQTLRVAQCICSQQSSHRRRKARRYQFTFSFTEAPNCAKKIKNGKVKNKSLHFCFRYESYVKRNGIKTWWSMVGVQFSGYGPLGRSCVHIHMSEIIKERSTFFPRSRRRTRLFTLPQESQ